MIRKRYLYFYVSIYLSINRICNYKVSVFIFCFLFTSIYNCFIYLSSPVSSRGKDQWQKFEFVGKRIKAFSVIDTLKPSTIQLAVYLSIFALSIYLSIANQFVNMDIYRYIHKWIGRYIYIIILYNFIDSEGDGWTESVADRDLVRYRGKDR